jgi:hypothetical protein
MTPEMDQLGSTPGGLLVDDPPPGRPDDGGPHDAGSGGAVDPGDDHGGAPPVDPAEQARRERFVRNAIDAAVVAICAVFVFANLHPSQILSSAVPAGGDMGAHVWGPAFLRDELLPQLRISGWTPDWYAGFPAYQFYMVVPSLLIVVLDVGLFGGATMVIPMLAGAGLVWWSRRVPAGPLRWAVVAAAVAVVVLGVELPYGTAFKLVTISGLVTLPAACYAFGRLADLPFPGPALLSAASVLFLFDRNFTIYGGNAASTLAGEFAFSISLSLAVLYLGVVVRGLRTGRHRGLAAVLLALTGLCHLIPAFFALGGTVVIALARRPTRRTATWLAPVLPIAGLLSAFWVLPFFWQRAFVNDMGWEKIPYPTEANGQRSLSGTLFSFGDDTYWEFLIPRSSVDSPNDLRWVLALACVGLVLSIAFRIRAGMLLAGFVLVAGVAFVLAPQGRLWNARLLPFYYLSLYLLAAVGVAELGRTLAVLAARDPDRPSIVGPALTAGVGLLAALVMVGLPLRTLPLGNDRADGSYEWMGLTNGAEDGSFVRSWARWNYTGYEGKDAYPEYRDLVRTMQDVGEEHGCGRSFWEYEKELNRYGTPMALMLLPHWTEGCIGSMEGLFFEASATTPFHFLTQVELSAAPSAAQRGLPYAGFDLDQGVDHLQMMGVRYYLATSVQATTAARDHPDLTEVAASGPWVVFQVADSDLVEGLEHEPAVLAGGTDHVHDWVCGGDVDGICAGDGPAVGWFTDPAQWDVALARTGPDAWQRIDAVTDADAPERRPVPPVEVTDIEAGTDEISFSVDQVGTPVLVKASYFPNWRASGAEGPYRVAPNLMVVVPTDTEVRLTYGREPVEWVAYGLTLIGLAGLVLLVRHDRRRRPTATDGGPAPSDGPSEPPRHLAPS